MLPICGRPMIEHVYRRASEASGLDAVVVLTDHEDICRTVENFGGVCEMTPSDCQSGTDRIAWAARNWRADAVVNVQGDEPLLDPSAITHLAEHLRSHAGEKMVTLAAEVDERALEDPNRVKVVCGRDGYALYFSRAGIPYRREASGGRGGGVSYRREASAGRSCAPYRGASGGGACVPYRGASGDRAGPPYGREASEDRAGRPDGRDASDDRPVAPVRLHVGIYGYRREVLLRLAGLEASPLERAENLEQLRALENGIRIRVLPIDETPLGVDTAEDLALAERRMRAMQTNENR